MLDKLIVKGTENYKCYDILKDLYANNPEFKKIVDEGIESGKVSGFSQELWDKLDMQNIRSRGVNSFCEVFRDGANLCYCTVCAKQVSYSLDNPYLCGGTNKFLIGTVNSPDGRHTWIENENKIIDTTFMLVISKDYVKYFGYTLENRYNPNIDPIYVNAKEFTNDKSLRR